MSYLPITDHGLIGDLHTAALVGCDGRITWLPWPRFDSPSLFAALLDAERGGDWLLAPDRVITSSQRYDGETAILLTHFDTPTGHAELRDWMSPWDGEAPSHDLCRVLRCTAGEVEVRGRFAPRPNYARARPELERRTDGLYFEAHGLELHVACGQDWQVEDGTATFRTTLQAGQEIRCILNSGQYTPEASVEADLQTTRRFWQDWVGKCDYDGLWRDEVHRSAITLKLLTYAPSGAIVAAPTTSLPEWIGGVRNWDYRYTWLRDASLTLYALYPLGYRSEAKAFFEWLAERYHQYDPPLQIMYGVGGEANLHESELEHLEGYCGSRPVRIGNGAHDQTQLDVYGGVVDAAYTYERQGELLNEQQWRVLRDEIDYVCAHWHEPDHGIWEIRGSLQQHTFSKMMCWLALDRGIRIAEDEGWQYDEERWKKTRAEIHANILEHGWNEEVGAFTMVYDGQHLDASLLLMPLIKFLPASDPRVRSTVEQIDRHLGRGALIYRYRIDDGLPGDEGAFLLCSFWMVDALALMGRLDEAVRRFEKLLQYGSAHALFSEMVNPETGTALGNYPQAFSHIGIVNSAVLLSRLMKRSEREPVLGIEQS